MMVGTSGIETEPGPDVATDSNMITFDNLYQNNTIGIVDVVNSTGIISQITPKQACEYYSVFHNTLGYVLKTHGAKVVKNIGDGILFYFPESDDLEKPLYCSSELLKAKELINKIFQKQNIPSIKYRISLDYGPLMIARYQTSSCSDIFGPTVNICSKINHLAEPNQIVIGGDFHEIIKKSKNYKFREITHFNSVMKQSYPIYSIIQE